VHVGEGIYGDSNTLLLVAEHGTVVSEILVHQCFAVFLNKINQINTRKSENCSVQYPGHI